MRYQEWDVLLFPAGEQEATHVPLKEFRTTCHVEAHQENSNHLYTTPLLTTFVPCLQRGAPFQISIHSWMETASVIAASTDTGFKPRELWQVNVVIDGICVAVENFDIDVTWPQIICTCQAYLHYRAS